ncbi:hypothetical protein NIES4103_30770 [Nostoc sp. NIES-4103]|nr:hypothetical protein NIES4103_30770 [Nostoc sp. NIES-4103]
MNKRLLAGLLAVSTAMTTIAVNAPSSYANSVDDGIKYGASNYDDVVEGARNLYRYGKDKLDDGFRWFKQNGTDVIDGGQKLNDLRERGQERYEEYQRGREERREYNRRNDY